MNALGSYKSKHGFSLIEMIITVLTIAVLAAILIPNLVVSRQRALDTQSQACLKEIDTQQLINFTDDFEYASIPMSEYPPACDNVVVTEVSMSSSHYSYTALHPQGAFTYRIETGSGVEAVP